MTTKIKTLLTVKTLNKKLANQITVVQYDGPDRPDSLHQKIYASLLSHDNAPVGWAAGKSLEHSGRTMINFWLVKMGPTYYWFIPPTSGDLHALHAPTLEQLFID